MGRHEAKKNGDKQPPTQTILLVTVILELIHVILSLIKDITS